MFTHCVSRVSWYTAGTRDPGTTGPTSQIKFSWTDGDQGEVTGAQFWFSDDVRKEEGNRIVYFTDGRVVYMLDIREYGAIIKLFSLPCFDDPLILLQLSSAQSV